MSDTPHTLAVYAGFWRRAAAAVIDGGLLLAVLLGLSRLAGNPDLLLREDWLPSLFSGLLGLAYAAGFESSRLQATPGKRLIGIKVTDLGGRRISLRRAVVRHLGQFLSAAVLMLGYVMAAFTQRRQALHDKLAGTLVVRAALSVEQVAQAAPAQAWSRWSIAALLAPLLATWLALWVLGLEQGATRPAQSDARYHARTEVAAALYYASEAIDLAESAYAENSEFTSVNLPSVDLGAEASRTIASLQVAAGSLHITFGGEAAAVLQGHTLTLTPALDGEGNIAWVCGYAEVPEGYDVVHEDYLSLTDVDASALTPDCLPEAEAAPEAEEPAPGLKA